jgi:glycerol dehydrogenase-like iron-containing ADH family enzyme
MGSPLNEARHIQDEFLMTDLDVGITFAEIALDSNDQDKIKRNTENARKAYETVLHFLPQTTPTQAERAKINEKAASLKSLLQRLGETF